MRPVFNHKVNIVNELGLSGRIFILAVLLFSIPAPGFGMLKANFNVSSTSVCSGSSVTFTDNSTGASGSATYSWDFGTGASPATATGIGPHVVTYTGSGTSTVSLTISDDPDTDTKSDFITVIEIPLSPVVTIADNCNGTSTLSTLASGLLLWSTSESTPSITVNAAGIYTVTSTTDGCMSLPGSGTAAPKTAPPAPVITVTDNCNSTSTLSTVAAGILLWSTSETTPSITVTIAGIYTVTSTTDGCTSLPGSGTAAPKTPPAIPLESVNCSLGFGKAEVTVTSPAGSGLEYSLDGGIYQTETIFKGVANGNHIITVRNAANCITSGNTFNVSCGCVDGPVVTSGSNSGSTCGTQPLTVSGNTFGGTATSVTITENGEGSVSPGITSLSPFNFTYTPAAGDAGKTITITLLTDNPSGAPCTVAIATYMLTVNAIPGAPSTGTITQPTCSLSTGSVVLSGLPDTGTWKLIRNTDGAIITGTGATTTITSLVSGTYNYTVTNSSGCTSSSSADIIINGQPSTPQAPAAGTITHPTCSLSTGSVILNGLPETGTWTLTRSPGGEIITGSGTGRTISDLPAGTYTFTVTSQAGCISSSSSAVIINSQPSNPAIPVVGTITSPTCSLSTGTVVLNGLSAAGTWVLTRYPGTVTVSGSGTSATVSGLSAGMYNFTLTNSTGCVSSASANVVIPAQPVTPAAPSTGTISQPTCSLSTGSVVLSGLPDTGTWKLIRNPDGIITSGTGTTFIVSEMNAGKYSFSVSGPNGCNSNQSSEVSVSVQPGIPYIIIRNPSTICSSDKVDLTSSAITNGSAAGLTFTYWTDASVTKACPDPARAGEGTYYIKGSSVSGCFDIKPVTVTVNPFPVSDAGPDQVLEYQFETTLNARLNNISDAGIWSVVSGKAVFNDNTSASTSVSGLSSGKNELLWTVRNGVCPPSSDTVNITVNDLKIQSLMTPNMDGRNDYFEIQGLNNLGRTELIVFDRRGMQVFKNVNYDNRWNGVDYSNNPLPDDTYFFVIRPEKGRAISGFIVIRR